MREGVNNSYASRMVNLSTRAQDIVAAILDADLPDQITLFDLAVDPPALWEDQRARVGYGRDGPAVTPSISVPPSICSIDARTGCCPIPPR